MKVGYENALFNVQFQEQIDDKHQAFEVEYIIIFLELWKYQKTRRNYSRLYFIKSGLLGR